MLSAMNREEIVLVAILDCSKCFDIIDHALALFLRQANSFEQGIDPGRLTRNYFALAGPRSAKRSAKRSADEKTAECFGPVDF